MYKETIAKNQNKTIDLFLFMGQSNMAGRGIVTKEHGEGVPCLIQGAGYEYVPCPPPTGSVPYPSLFAALRTARAALTTAI